MASKDGICGQCHQERKIPESRALCSGCRAFNSNVKAGRIRKPDFADITTAGYKEPMQKVEDGFGFYGAVTRTNDGQHIQCHICGYYYANVSAHVIGKHAMNSRQYKETYGLRIGDGLLAPGLRVKMQEVYNDHLRKVAVQYLPQAWAAAEEKRKNGDFTPGGDMWTAQTRNEKGMCRAQTIAKMKRIADQQNGYIEEKQFYEEYGSGQREVIAHWFGSWDGALEATGYTGFKMRRAQQKEQVVEHAIGAVADFYESEGRTPQFSDFMARQELPNPRKMSRVFGSLNELRRQSGAPRLIHVGGGRWKEEM